MNKSLKSIVLFIIFLLIFVCDAFAQEKNTQTIETNTLTIFTYNYQKGKFDKGVVKNKSFTFDISKKGEHIVFSRYNSQKKKKQATISVKKVANDHDRHETYYSSEYKTTICLKQNNIIVHFEEHLDQPSEIRVYSLDTKAEELVHATMDLLSKK